MAIEIERKFLLKSRAWMPLVKRHQRIHQGYLSNGGPTSIRVRLIDEEATLTVKMAASGMSRHEFEYPIPPADAQMLLKGCVGFPISKTRHFVPSGALTWTIDVFEGENAGLEIAEVELDHEHQDIGNPPWIGEEVTHDRRYYNADLARTPFKRWHI